MKFANNNNKRSEKEREKDKSPAPLPQIKLVAKKTQTQKRGEDALAFGAKLNFASAAERRKKRVLGRADRIPPGSQIGQKDAALSQGPRLLIPTSGIGLHQTRLIKPRRINCLATIEPRSSSSQTLIIGKSVGARANIEKMR
jgi:hypothetical protein